MSDVKEEAMSRNADAFDEPSLSRRAWLPGPPAASQSPTEMSLAEHVANQIERLAADREPGARLGSKDELREFAGVSVGTINEALRIAQARGAITMRRGPGGGIFAAPTSSLMRMGALMLGMETDERTIADALRMRNALDPLALTDAVANATDEDVAELRAMTVEMRDALERGDVDGYVRRHWAFQARVTSISPNPLLRTVFISLLGILDEQTVAVFPAGADLAEEIEIRVDIHERMVLALERRDLAAAFEVMRDYIASQPELVRPPTARLI